MLQINNLSYSIGERELLKDIDWTISPGKRIALIGGNGMGKTTLFRILTGELEYDAGEIFKAKEYKIGYLPQEEKAADQGTVFNIVKGGRPQLVDLENRIHALREKYDHNKDTDIHELGELEHQFETLGGYKFESEIKTILAGLGFQENQFNEELSNFSGGWRMRVYLARILINTPDLLLLDEPTNHLDLPSLEWLESYLLSFTGSIVLISHDRFFIDRLANEIVELEFGRLTSYAGNYHFYEQKKEEEYELALKRQEEIDAERKHQQEFIDRFRYKNTKAKAVQSRVKALEKLEDVEIRQKRKHISFELSVAEKSYKEVIVAQDMGFRYEEPWVLRKANLNIYRGDRVALVGVNGAGKTTFTRLMVQEYFPQEGSLKVGERVHIGYYAQHQIDSLDLDKSVYDEVASTVANSLIPKIRDVLGIFQFKGEDVYKKISVLSGGEKARVSLAKILLSPVNFLIMDEPTNHLDIGSKEALERSLANYEGTLVLISHDRYFLDQLVNRVVEIKDTRIKEFEGNYTDYLNRRDVFVQQENTEKVEKTQNKTKEEKRRQAEARQAISKQRNVLQKQVDTCESNIENLENRKQELEALLADPETYNNNELSVNSQKEYNQVKKDLEQNYSDWEKVQHELEELLEQIQ